MMADDFRVSVLISGRGSNLASLIRNAAKYTVSSIFTDNPEAAGLQYAKDTEIKTFAFSRSDYSDKEKFKNEIFDAVHKENPDLIALAGFMRVVPEWFVLKYDGKIINIHPALLPKFPGLHTHQRALEAGEKEHGCTVHYVDMGIDTGPLIAQGACAVMPDDNAEILAARVLDIEHRLYPWVVKHIASGEIALKNRSVFISEKCEIEAKESGFFLRGERKI